jgi:hypothetical protein
MPMPKLKNGCCAECVRRKIFAARRQHVDPGNVAVIADIHSRLVGTPGAELTAAIGLKRSPNTTGER